jgi:hypothetical protein
MVKKIFLSGVYINELKEELKKPKTMYEKKLSPDWSTFKRIKGSLA